ncbi:MAG: hypothetical protein H6741_24010 [Alphaproteobacteria bacterium]|nr:hypothetical protein [Alphaproteobacteria bacterium]
MRGAWLALGAAVGVLAAPRAFAAGGGAEEGASQEVILLIGAIAIAYLIAHFVVEWLQERFFFTTGSEYMLVGVLLGPATHSLLVGQLGLHVPQVVSEDAVLQLGPLIELAIGWVGLLYGAQLNLGQLLSSRDGSISLSALSSLAAFVVIGGGSYLALSTLEPVEGAPMVSIWLASTTLGAIGAVTSPAVLDLVSRRFQAEGPTTDMLRRSLRLDELIAIAGFGLISAWFHQQTALNGHALDATHWFVGSIVLGGFLGALFHFFIGHEHDAEKQFMAFVGIVVFSSGAAYYLQVSPLLVNMVLGVAMVNVTDESAEDIIAVLESTRRPMYILLLFFAGAMWTPVAWAGVGLALIFLVVRTAGVFVGGFVAAFSLGRGHRRDLGRALLGQGELAVAMALNYYLLFRHDALADVVFTAALMSVLLNELWSTRLLKGLLIDSGDIRHEIADAPAAEGA